MFNFDNVPDRRGTSCFKYDARKELFGTEDILPMWVADMDFQSPPCVREAAMRLSEHGVFGYTFRSAQSVDYFIDWVDKRYGWKIKREQITSSPGIVAALPVAVRVFTSQSDKILIQTPVYPPFHSIVKENGRTLVYSPLICGEDGWSVNWQDFEEKLSKGVKMFILCNSHNPIGKVWTRDELQKMGELCCKYNTIIFSDEIHSDLALYNNNHTVMASVSEEIAQNTITAMAPSKTFNIAGMLNSLIISESKELFDKFHKEITTLHLELGNIFGHITMEAAYKDGAHWLAELKKYLEQNIDFAHEFVKREIPGVKFIKPEGSFLLWLNFKETGLSHKEIKELLVKKAKVGLNDGLTFGPDGEFHFRMNIGTSLAIVKEGFERIAGALRST